VSGRAARIAPAEWTRLAAAATRARGRAYAPYSSFAVGAALLSEDGRIFAGCNVENASLGLTICAERSAVCAAVAAGRRRFRALALVGGTRRPAAPCGACRQVLAEFAPDLPIRMTSADGVVETTRLGLLLPAHFGPDDLG
jgi:cytidine deaminase